MGIENFTTTEISVGVTKIYVYCGDKINGPMKIVCPPHGCVPLDGGMQSTPSSAKRKTRSRRRRDTSALAEGGEGGIGQRKGCRRKPDFNRQAEIARVDTLSTTQEERCDMCVYDKASAEPAP